MVVHFVLILVIILRCLYRNVIILSSTSLARPGRGSAHSRYIIIKYSLAGLRSGGSQMGRNDAGVEMSEGQSNPEDWEGHGLDMQ